MEYARYLWKTQNYRKNWIKIVNGIRKDDFVHAVREDPRLTDVSEVDLRAQFDLAVKIRDLTSAANENVILIRNLRVQVKERLSRIDDRIVREVAEGFVELISVVEKELYQVRNQSSKDKIAFPIKINNRLSGLRGNLERGDGPPLKGYYQVFEELSAELKAHLEVLKRILRDDLTCVNKELARLGLKRIVAHRK